MDDHLPRIKKLTKLLFLSGSANIILAALLVYWVIREQPPAPYFEMKPADRSERQAPLAMAASNAELVRELRKMPLEQLKARLGDARLVENGYTQRDLALACMVAIYHFDLERSLGDLRKPLQERKLVYGKFKNGTPASITLYPGLNDEHYQAIVQFARTEKWPLTSQGLFSLLRRQHRSDDEIDPSLVDAFFLTTEFKTASLLFSRSGHPVDRQKLLELLMEGDWKTLSTFTQQQRTAQDNSTARRQHFLTGYLKQGSQKAAYMLLATDTDFAAKKLDDKDILMMLTLLKERTEEAERFALSQLASPRGDAALKMAARRLYEYAGEVPPEQFSHAAALERFMPKSAAVPLAIKPPSKPPQPVVKRPPPAPAPAPARETVRLYVVQEGDSLWKISRRFKVDIDKIKQANRLRSDALKPGLQLRIPSA